MKFLLCLWDAAHKRGSFLPYVNAEGLEIGFHVCKPPVFLLIYYSLYSFFLSVCLTKAFLFLHLTQGIYNETASLGFHVFGHSPQMPHRPYAPVSSHLPPVADPSRLPNARHFPTSDSSYHQPPVPLNILHVTSKAQFSHIEFPLNLEQQVDGKRLGLTVGWNALIYQVWRERNNRLFKQKEETTE